MNLLEIIYYIGVGAVCFIAGMVVEMFIDNKAIMELQDDNRKLRLENEQLKKEAKHEVIEIVDNRKDKKDFQFGGF
jgi:regulator of replication initiation timing